MSIISFSNSPGKIENAGFGFKCKTKACSEITIINNIFEIQMAAESTYHRSKYDINQQHDIFDELINYYEES